MTSWLSQNSCSAHDVFHSFFEEDDVCGLQRDVNISMKKRKRNAQFKNYRFLVCRVFHVKFLDDIGQLAAVGDGAVDALCGSRRQLQEVAVHHRILAQLLGWIARLEAAHEVVGQDLEEVRPIRLFNQTIVKDARCFVSDKS